MDPDHEKLLRGGPIPYTKNLKCSFCNRKFTIMQNLRRHMKNQHLGYRFPCSSCIAEFTRKEDIVKHYNLYHPDNIDEIDLIQEVCKLTEDGKVKPRNHVIVKIKTPRRSKKQPFGNDSLTTRGVKTESSNSPVHETEVPDVSDTQSVETSSIVQNVVTGTSSAPERVVIALDPVTQFRIERVIAERVDTITEKSVIETMDESGRVTRRETIERKYHLSNP